MSVFNTGKFELVEHMIISQEVGKTTGQAVRDSKSRVNVFFDTNCLVSKGLKLIGNWQSLLPCGSGLGIGQSFLWSECEC